MTATIPSAQRQTQLLAELAELGMAVARGLAARSQEAATLEEAQAFALAFHQVSRSVRLCVALEGRLERERLQGWRELRARTEHAATVRKAQVRCALERLIYDEREYEETERNALLDELEERLAEEALFEDFAQLPLDAAVSKLRADLGIVANDLGLCADPAPRAAQAQGPPPA